MVKLTSSASWADIPPPMPVSGNLAREGLLMLYPASQRGGPGSPLIGQSTQCRYHGHAGESRAHPIDSLDFPVSEKSGAGGVPPSRPARLGSPSGRNDSDRTGLGTPGASRSHFRVNYRSFPNQFPSMSESLSVRFRVAPHSFPSRPRRCAARLRLRARLRHACGGSRTAPPRC